MDAQKREGEEAEGTGSTVQRPIDRPDDPPQGTKPSKRPVPREGDVPPPPTPNETVDPIKRPDTGHKPIVPPKPGPQRGTGQ
jgi:hypothetical protein